MPQLAAEAQLRQLHAGPAAETNIEALERCIASSRQAGSVGDEALREAEAALADARRVQAAARLQQLCALDAGEVDVNALEAAVATAQKVGIDATATEKAKRTLSEAKRSQAETRLRSAQSGDTANLDLDLLQREVSAARAVGIAESTLQAAEQKLGEVQKGRGVAAAAMREAAAAPLSAIDADALLAAITAAERAGVRSLI